VEPAPRQRVVLIGASNMTRGLAVLIETCRRAWGDPIDIVAALGHGRSYGMASNVLGRGLPSVLECGLWRALDDAPAAPTLAVVGDVGNDILYGAPVPRILEWVEETIVRLQARGVRTILTSLPPPALTLGRAHFLVFRTLFFPARRLRFEPMRASVPALDEGLRALARSRNTLFVELRPEWYRFDPIHIRPRRCREAWAEVLRAAGPVVPCPRVGILRGLGTYRMLPERQWMFGREMRRRQPCRRLPTGTTISLF
jgi:hypothetical protein